MFMIKEIPKTERPRERFMKHGPNALSNHELLAIILRTGSKEQSVIDLSKQVLYNYDSLKDLSTTTVEELTQIKGIGTSKAIEILTVFELSSRIKEETYHSKVNCQSPEQIYIYMKDALEMKTQEHLVVLYLNTKGNLIKKKTLFKGSLNSSVIHPREIFKYAVLFSAASLVLVHNHPSGDPTPSHHDMEITKRILDNSIMMDIYLLDHIIIGRDKYYSFKEHSIL